MKHGFRRAERIAKKIQQHWNVRSGAIVRVEIVRDETGHVVRSDMINGLPRNFANQAENVRALKEGRYYV